MTKMRMSQPIGITIDEATNLILIGSNDSKAPQVREGGREQGFNCCLIRAFIWCISPSVPVVAPNFDSGKYLRDQQRKPPCSFLQICFFDLGDYSLKKCISTGTFTHPAGIAVHSNTVYFTAQDQLSLVSFPLDLSLDHYSLTELATFPDTPENLFLSSC